MCGTVRWGSSLGVKYAVAFNRLLWYPAEVGAPAPLAYVPEFNSPHRHMNLLQRMKNTRLLYFQNRDQLGSS